MDRTVKMKACMNETNRPRPRKTAGTTTGTSAMNPETTAWSPVMLPKRRSERDMGRARWEMISMGSMMGASHQMGPRK